MSDITLCTATHCPMSDKCYRKKENLVNQYRHSYYNFQYVCFDEEGFSSFIPLQIIKNN